MTIQPISTPQLTASQAPQGSEPKDPTLVERIVDKTILSANYMGSTLAGGVGGAGAFGRSVVGTTLGTTAAAFTNLWKTETIGPNLKILGSALVLPVAAAAVAISAPVSLVAGMIYGAREVDSSKPREFTVAQAGASGYGKTRSGWEKAAQGMKEGLTEWGNEKLEPGEKPVDIPLIKTAKTMAVGVAAAAVGGVAGAVCAVVSAGRQIGAGVAKAFTDQNLNLPGKVIAAAGAVVGGAVQGVTYGLASGVSILGTGISQTWKNDSLVQGSKAVVTHAAQSLKAAAAPHSTLLEEVPQKP